MNDPSVYSAIDVDPEDHRDARYPDERWVSLWWDGWPKDVQAGRYRLTVDPHSGWILFVDEEDDVRVLIDERNLQVLVNRAERVKAADMAAIKREDREADAREQRRDDALAEPEEPQWAPWD